MDRRRRYQRNHRKHGLCDRCPKPRAKGDTRLCASHRKAERARDAKRRKADGWRTWKPGSRGRPPLWAVAKAADNKARIVRLHKQRAREREAGAR